MPNANSAQTAYITTGNPDTLNDPTPTNRPGELGNTFEWNDKGYQLVQCDSGAVAATATGVVAANQVAFWKDRSRYIVTNNSPQAILGQTTNAYRNEVAGIFRTAVTAGNVCAILQRGPNISVKADGGTTFAPGEIVFANSGTAADVTSTDAGTAPTYLTMGTARAAASGGNVSVDLNIPSAP